MAPSVPEWSRREAGPPQPLPAVALGYAYQTVRDARTGLVNEALIILVVMLTTIAVSGGGHPC